MFVNFNTSKPKMFILNRHIVSFVLSLRMPDANPQEKKKTHCTISVYRFPIVGIRMFISAISAVTQLVQCVEIKSGDEKMSNMNIYKSIIHPRMNTATNGMMILLCCYRFVKIPNKNL